MPEEDLNLSERVRSRAHGAPASRRPAYFAFKTSPQAKKKELSALRAQTLDGVTARVWA